MPAASDRSKASSSSQHATLETAGADRSTRLPRLPRKYVPRLRLWDSLEEASESAITVLVAPVGAGKTLGVVGWLHTGTHPNAVWVAASPDLTVAGLDRLTSQTTSDGEPRLLVIDDAQSLSGDVLAHLDQRLSEDPRSLHLLLISRWDLPFTRLVPELLGDLTVLRGDLLRLTEAEAAVLVAEHARTDSAEVSAAIAARADGWCAAVVLAARAVAGEPDPVTAARRLMSSSSVVDKVASEVFAALTARQRHLLLCLAGEGIATPTLARHLSHDDDAGRLLEDLESTGLLVTRYFDAGDTLDGELGRGHDGGEDVERSFAAQKYRLHPLLLEVARRRLALGGVDVERARSTVRRAVALDVDRGLLHDALRRLVAIGDLRSAARLLVDYGVTLVLAGEAEALATFVRHHGDEVESEPMCAFPVALDRWLAGDLKTAGHWLHRIVVRARTEQPGSTVSPVWELEVAIARLMQARLGDGSLTDAVHEAETSLEHFEADTQGTSPLLPLLKLHLGVVQLQLGRLEDADRHLTEALQFGRSAGLPTLSAEASSKLALSQFLQGREHACVDLAEDSMRMDVTGPDTVLPHGGVRLAGELAVLQSVVDPHQELVTHVVEPSTSDAAYDTHVVANALGRLLTARRLLLRGMATEAHRTLDDDSLRSRLPLVVLVPVLLEQALQAALAADNDRLNHLEDNLREVGAAGEAAFVAALRAEGLGDTRGAMDHFDTAASISTCVQPPVVAMALTGRAQLLHGEGRAAEATEDLRAALAATEVRRNALPFLGWSRHGTAMGVLLRAVLQTASSPWARELLAAVDAQPGITSTAAALTATPRERARVADGVVRPTLSPRERDVLHELARGATYADVAANLFVSENTVKTHVSSLYAKLAVSRRSDALAVSRTLGML